LFYRKYDVCPLDTWTLWHCLFWESYKTQKYILQEKCIIVYKKAVAHFIITALQSIKLIISAPLHLYFARCVQRTVIERLGRITNQEQIKWQRLVASHSLLYRLLGRPKSHRHIMETVFRTLEGDGLWMMLSVNNWVFFVIYITEIILNKFCVVFYETVQFIVSFWNVKSDF